MPFGLSRPELGSTSKPARLSCPRLDAKRWRPSGVSTIPAARLKPKKLSGGGSPFSIAGVPIARDALVVGAGLALKLAPGAEVALSYDGQLAKHATDHAFNARLAVRF